MVNTKVFFVYLHKLFFKHCELKGVFCFSSTVSTKINVFWVFVFQAQGAHSLEVEANYFVLFINQHCITGLSVNQSSYQMFQFGAFNPRFDPLFQQVPATVVLPGAGNSATASEDRLDGTVLVLTEDPSGRIVFALSMASTPARTAAYAAQMDHFLLLLHQEVQRTGVGKLSDMDSVLSSILSLVYYFYNLTPLTRGSSVVAYAVVLGLIMSLGRQVGSAYNNVHLSCAHQCPECSHDTY